MSWPCQDNSLVGVSGRRARVSAMRCRRWSCAYCAKRLRRKTVRLAYAGFTVGERVRMLTLTSPAGEDPQRSYDELRKRWKRLRESLRRRFPGLRLEYFAVIERQQRGVAHLHVLTRGGYIPQAWLSQAAACAGFGPVVDIRNVGRAAGRYVAKYLGKEMGDVPERLGFPPLPPWHRRATWSRGWAPVFMQQLAMWRARLRQAGYAWYIANGRPVLVAYRLQTLGYELDEIDYGDRPLRDQAWELRRQEPLLARTAGNSHRGCWLCESHDPAARRPHQADWTGLPAAPTPQYELWPQDAAAEPQDGRPKP